MTQRRLPQLDLFDAPARAAQKQAARLVNSVSQSSGMWPSKRREMQSGVWASLLSTPPGVRERAVRLANWLVRNGVTHRRVAAALAVDWALNHERIQNPYAYYRPSHPEYETVKLRACARFEEMLQNAAGRPFLPSDCLPSDPER